jgi:hypothetical protein
MHQKVLKELLIVPALIVDHVVDQAAEKRDIRAGADRRIDIAHGARAGETRIDVNQLGPIQLSFHGPAKCNRVVFRHIGAHEHTAIGVLHRAIGQGGGAATEAGPQTGDAGAVSYPRLILDRNDTQTP